MFEDASGPRRSGYSGFGHVVWCGVRGNAGCSSIGKKRVLRAESKQG